jgi:hypothetical protein
MTADQAAQDVQQQFLQQAQAPNLPPQMREFYQQVANFLTADNIRTTNLIFAGLSLVTLLGAVQMLRLRMYWLAVLGSLLALNPLNCPCCLIEVPFALWALVVLLSADVRAAFR